MDAIKNTYYGIFDEVTNEGLSKYSTTVLEWSATMENGKFFRFNSLEEALCASGNLTEIFRKSDKECEIRWNIVTIKESLTLEKSNYVITK